MRSPGGGGGAWGNGGVVSAQGEMSLLEEDRRAAPGGGEGRFRFFLRGGGRKREEGKGKGFATLRRPAALGSGALPFRSLSVKERKKRTVRVNVKELRDKIFCGGRERGSLWGGGEEKRGWTQRWKG